MEQQIRFCTTGDGVRIAYTTVGQGPALVVAPGWVSHLQLQWDYPAGRAYLEKATRHRTFVYYDKHGCGLSERSRNDFSVESEIRPLEAVVDHLKLKRFALFSFSQSGPIGIAYTVKHPRRVSHLLLFDTYARGEAITTDEIKASFLSLVRAHWGVGSKTLTDLFLPEAELSAVQWFTRLQREAATPEMAAQLMEFTYRLNVTDLLPRVRVPTLVMHRQGDRAIPFRCGREMAAMIPNARFVPLEGNMHIPFFGDADAVQRCIAEFLGDSGDSADAAPTRPTVKSFKRKLTAIMSADVKGYSRLMGEDEEGTIRILNVYMEVITGFIQQHRGRVVATGGDSVLAEFASVVDAVRCAVGIQEELKDRNKELPEGHRMEFRIGVNLGDVVEEGNNILGDGVNIAARLESLAEAGGICISGIVYDQIEKKLSLGYEHLGEQSVKNIEKPVRVYRVLMEPRASVPRETAEKKAKTRQ